MATKRANLSRRKANVSINRNGLIIEVPDIPAVDAGVVAAELVQVMRTLAKKFEELVHDAGHVGGGGGIEIPDDDGVESESDPMVARKRVGFR